MNDKSFKAIMEHFKKAGDFAPELVNIGGALRPQESDKFIDLAVKGNPILSRVTVDRAQRLTKDVNVFELLRGVLQRVPQGTRPANYTSFANVGKKLEMKDAQLFARIPFDFLRDNQHRPNLENMVNGILTTAYGNDIVLLALTGAADDYAGKAFAKLNKGWPRLVQDASGSHKVDIGDHTGGTPAAVSWESVFSAMVEALPDLYKGDKTAFLMNRGDAELYQRQIGQMVGGLGYLLQKQNLTYLGYEIVALNEMPRNCVLLTPLPNLVYGVNTNMERYREVSGEERCIRYTFDSAFDFQVAVDDAAVIAYEFPSA
jgi:hypothetical protein